MSTPSLHSKKKKSNKKIRPSLTKGNKNSCKIKSSEQRGEKSIYQCLQQ